MKLQLLEKPLKLQPGCPAILKINGHSHVVKVVTDDGETVTFTYPLRPNDTKIYHAFKEHVFVKLKQLSTAAELSIKASANVVRGSFNIPRSHANNVRYSNF